MDSGGGRSPAAPRGVGHLDPIPGRLIRHGRAVIIDREARRAGGFVPDIFDGEKLLLVGAVGGGEAGGEPAEDGKVDAARDGEAGAHPGERRGQFDQCGKHDHGAQRREGPQRTAAHQLLEQGQSRAEGEVEDDNRGDGAGLLGFVPPAPRGHAERGEQGRGEEVDRSARCDDTQAGAERQEEQPEGGAQSRPFGGARHQQECDQAGGDGRGIDGGGGDDGISPPEISGANEADDELAEPGQRAGSGERGRHGEQRHAERAAAPAFDQEEEQEHAEQDEAEQHRQDDEAEPGNIGVEPLALDGLRGAGGGLLGHRERLDAHMLEAAPVERGEIVARAVIARFVADHREIEDRPGPRLEHRDVGRIGDQPVKIGRKRIGDRARRGAVEPDGGPVRPAGFEHDRRAGDAARLEVDDRVHAGSKRIAIEEGAGAEQAHFLAFVEQEGDRTGEALAAQQMRDLQHRRGADPVVARARACEGAIVVRDEENVLALRRADRGDEVADPGAGDRAAAGEAVAGEIVGDARIEADGAHLREQALAHRIARRRCRPDAAAGRRGFASAAPSRGWRRSRGRSLAPAAREA